MRKVFQLSLLAALLLLVSNISLAQDEAKGFHLIDVPSPSLENCLVGAKKTQKVGIYLPPSYFTSQKRYPVVYNLTGYTVHPGEFPPSGWLDSIMDNKLVQEMIYVEISGYNILEGTMYANSPVTGNWEDFVTKDVISYIDKNYRTLAKRESRGLSGHSMGGGGSFNISLKHADKYSVAYPMSPAISSHDSLMNQMFNPSQDPKPLKDIIERMKDVPDDKFEEKLAEIMKEYQGGFNWLIAQGFAFSPDLTKPLKIAWPVDLNAEKFTKIEEIWQKWEQGFGGLEKKVEKYKENLLSYTHYSIDCGYYDGIKWIYSSTNHLAKLLTENNIPFSMNLYNGDHVNKVGTQMANRVMPIMSMYLAKE